MRLYQKSKFEKEGAASALMGLGVDSVDPGVIVPLDDPSGAGTSDGAN
jgi:hypothetical protein